MRVCRKGDEGRIQVVIGGGQVPDKDGRICWDAWLGCGRRVSNKGEEGRNHEVTGGGLVPQRATTPKPKRTAGVDPAAAHGQRGAEQAEHLQ